jgi:hypothetical protein
MKTVDHQCATCDVRWQGSAPCWICGQSGVHAFPIPFGGTYTYEHERAEA